MDKFNFYFFKYRWIFFALSFLCLFFINNLWVYLFFVMCILLMCVASVKLDFCHPYCNILPLFLLYQIAYPILNNYGIVVFKKMPLNNNYFLYSYSAIILFIIFLGKVKKIKYCKEKISLELKSKMLYSIFIILGVLAFSSSIYILIKGYSTKYELAQNMDFFIKIGSMAYVGIIPITCTIFLNKNSNKKIKIIFCVLSLILMLFGMMTTGERSYIFNYIMMAFLIYMSFYDIGFKKKIALILIMIFFVANSANLKMFFNKNNPYTDNKREENFVFKFLNSDFASQGFNFNFLLENDERYEKFYGKTYVYDLLSPVDDLIPSLNNWNSNRWYQNTFWATRRTGLGFTIVGEGYINFGVFGIVLSMFFLAFLTKRIYNASQHNAYLYILYFAFVNYSMYANRGNFGNIISPLFKYYVLILIIIYYLNYVEYNNKKLYYKDKLIYSFNKKEDDKYELL